MRKGQAVGVSGVLVSRLLLCCRHACKLRNTAAVCTPAGPVWALLGWLAGYDQRGNHGFQPAPTCVASAVQPRTSHLRGQRFACKFICLCCSSMCASSCSTAARRRSAACGSVGSSCERHEPTAQHNTAQRHTHTGTRDTMSRITRLATYTGASSASKT